MGLVLTPRVGGFGKIGAKRPYGKAGIPVADEVPGHLRPSDRGLESAMVAGVHIHGWRRWDFGIKRQEQNLRAQAAKRRVAVQSMEMSEMDFPESILPCTREIS
jgi:hypothetical protein